MVNGVLPVAGISLCLLCRCALLLDVAKIPHEHCELAKQTQRRYTSMPQDSGAVFHSLSISCSDSVMYFLATARLSRFS